MTNAVPFTSAEQREFVGWMYRGASPLGACERLGTDIDRFWKTYDTDAAFALAIQQVYETLALNVVAVLYRAVMEGNITAIRLWLEHRPSLAWSRAVAFVEPDFGNDTDEQLKQYAGLEALVQEVRCIEGTPSP